MEARRTHGPEGSELAAAARRRMVLFAGCRDSLPFEDELRAAAASGEVDISISVAISRPTPPAEGVYVQALLEAEAHAVWRLLQEHDTYAYVCGGTAMGQDVHAALLNIAQRIGGHSPAEARDLLRELRAAGRYVAELWG